MLPKVWLEKGVKLAWLREDRSIIEKGENWDIASQALEATAQHCIPSNQPGKGFKSTNACLVPHLSTQDFSEVSLSPSSLLFLFFSVSLSLPYFPPLSSLPPPSLRQGLTM